MNKDQLAGAVELLKALKRDLMHARRFGPDTLANYRRACSAAECDVEAWLIGHGNAKSVAQAATAQRRRAGDGEVAVRAKTVHRRIDALCEAANTAGADYFDASTSMLIATQDLLTALGFPHRMVAPQPQAAEPKGCPRCTSSTAAGCNDIGGGYLDAGSGEPNSAEPKGLSEEQRTMISRLANGLELMTKLAAERACISDVLVASEWIKQARALLAKGE